ncbi:MAG: alpha/beta hydrolase-fold protein [Bacteroidota bacterium]|nr:alpha/beta hydrolase-fold protein [Bacteroidota bacterium]
MKSFLLLLVPVFALASCGNLNTDQADKVSGEAIVIGQMDSLRSEILDETRNIWVHVPDEAAGAVYGKTTYPVLYLLDGPGHFHAVTGLLNNLGQNAIVPRMVVVAIPNTDRTRDLTPSHVDVMFGDSSFVKTSGGGDKFMEFMEKELIPYVEGKYPVTGYRTFVGHSFGGLTAVYALFSHPHLFSNYVAIDPSMWWDDWLLVKKTDAILEGGTLEGKALFLGVANTMAEGMDVDRVREDTAQSSNHIRSILGFIEKLENKEDFPLEFGWKYYEDDDHGSVPLITEYDALRFLFPWYRLKGLNKFFEEDAEDDPAEILMALEEHYKQVSEHFGYPVPPSEPDVNSLGYNFMNMNKPAIAQAMFELNIKNYPESANVYDSMGDFYLDQADTLQAVEQFRKALELGDSPFTREKLSQLEQE